MKLYLLLLLIGLHLQSSSQKTAGKFIKDKQHGCKVWVENYNPKDSLTINWDGDCKDKMAAGSGTLIFYIKSKEVARYTGEMGMGNPNGQGKYHYVGDVTAEGNFVNGNLNGQGKISFENTDYKLEGNFVNGQLLNLGAKYLNHLEKNFVTQTDSTEMYVNDNDSDRLHYYALVPEIEIKGVIVLLPGTWDQTAYVLSSNQKLAETAFDKGIAVIVPSVNQRLTLNDDVLNFLNTVFNDSVDKYKLPADKFVLGGFSMGGLFSIRYTELSVEAPTKTVIKPAAVYSVDGPTDLEIQYGEFEKAHEKNPDAGEPKYALNEFKQYIGGSPKEFPEKYIYYSTYSRSQKDGGNAKYLKNIPVRIYNDLDVNWWMDNRGADLYNMNALNQSAMINFLHKTGNNKAEFINAFGKGYRLEGKRHPHSWSIVDAEDCVGWVLKCLE